MRGDPEPSEVEGDEGDDLGLAECRFRCLRVQQIPPEVGRISHAWAISNISPLAFEGSHSAITDKQG
jgi:hypothetical protein